MFHYSNVRQPIVPFTNGEEPNIDLLLTSSFDPIMTLPQQPLYGTNTFQDVWSIQEQSETCNPNMHCEKEDVLRMLFEGSDPFLVEQAPVTRREMPKKRRNSSNARIGYCQHPKHLDYRQESASVTPPTPRRGRPPKGTKAIDRKTVKEGHVWAMTVRPLPKRLEKVVGQTNIKVCLTCLKRSDLDPAYLTHPAYVGPQQQQRK